MPASFSFSPTIEAAVRSLEQGDLAAAEGITQTILATQDGDANALYVLGLVRLQQGRAAEAAALLARVIPLRPGQPPLLRHYASALSQQGQHDRAASALAEAVGLAPDLADAWFELGRQQHALGDRDKAETSYLTALALEPQHHGAQLTLGSLLLETGHAAKAEAVLAEGFRDAGEGQLAIDLEYTLTAAQQHQGKKEAALRTLAHLQQLAPGLGDLDTLRGQLLDEMFRFDEALAAMRTALDRNPLEAGLHDAYNDLLYRLGRDDEFLTSYDRAPASTPLQLGKATFLRHAKRHAEAHDVYAGLLTREPGNVDAVCGAADALSGMNLHTEAIRLVEWALAGHPNDARLNVALATAALRARDPAKSAIAAQKSLTVTPDNKLALALLGSAWRAMGDERDEILNGYDTLVRTFDLEPPDGFSDMAAFNAELAEQLAQQHPPTREFLSQSLRGGTQAANLFEGGHDLVNRLRRRLSETLDYYIAEMKRNDAHPFLSRRRKGFSYSGSWSSRLRDCGFHVNHIHPEGWISCCYYVGVPDAVADQEAKQGWIKFGEPAFDIGLGPRRAIQPVPGRLVLFPSYMWHGTIPFRSEAIRTTIAFDVISI